MELPLRKCNSVTNCRRCGNPPELVTIRQSGKNYFKYKCMCLRMGYTFDLETGWYGWQQGVSANWNRIVNRRGRIEQYIKS